MTGKAKEDTGAGPLPFDESKMEGAIEALAGEAERIREDDPRQAAQLMRKFTKMTGMEMGSGMQEALKRMESGEDPEAIEKEMGDVLEQEDPFKLPEKVGGRSKSGRGAPRRDHKLYDL
jgi:hypothetical protein